MKSQQSSKKPNLPDLDSENADLVPDKKYADDMASKSVRNPWRPIIVRYIHGHSMMPVLPPGTLIWARSWFKKFKTGDTVIFLHEGKEKIKRIADIKDKELYLLGDHPETSTDSRQFGWIPSDQIIAKVFWPHAPKERAEETN